MLNPIKILETMEKIRERKRKEKKKEDSGM
jgi:hypothetical protein